MKLEKTKSELKTFKKIEEVYQISRDVFFRDYVDKSKPVIIKGMVDDWDALAWDENYFKERETGVEVAIKTGDVSQGNRKMVLLSDYIETLENYELKIKSGERPPRPAYLHDIPFFHLFPEYIKDIKPFPIHLFPEWYSDNWANYIQFFMGSTGSLTPLHFDTLLTNNLFFQIKGEKKFILIPATDKDRCYLEGWRWAKFDPVNPDYDKYPLAKQIEPKEAVISAGDILFIPSGMLHQVHGLSYSISFNIDWHTAKTAKEGMMSLFRGAPTKNAYYNFLSYLGVALNVPSKYIFPYYKPYLNYVS